MPFSDLREYISKLEKMGELVRVKKEVDWNLEAGAIARRCNEIEAPIPYFEKIKGYSKEFTVLGDIINTLKRLSIAMEQPTDLPYAEMYRNLMQVYLSGIEHPIKPRVVKTGPCKENIMKGNDVNLYKFPSLMLHDGDGGRYIGTAHTVITKDFDSGWVNWGCYRQMIHNRNHLGGYVAPPRDMAIMLRKYEERNKPMEFAIAMGTDPVVFAVGISPVPYKINEVDVIGGIRKEPVDVIKCETVDLMVPATSEIVIEGHVLPGVRVDEGPFGEYTGYRASPRAPRLVYKVDCITHRNSPILTAVCEGAPVDSGHVANSIARAATIRTDLVNAGIPVVDVHVVIRSSGFLTVVSTKTPYSNIAHRIASVVWGSRAAQSGSHKVMVVNDDIDPFNIDEVVHAFATKCHPVRGHHAVPNAAGHPLVPYQNLEERLWAKNSLMLYDCTWPIDWPVEIAIPPKASFNSIYPKELQDKVLANWKNYGFRE